jgi:hypothetical protein
MKVAAIKDDLNLYARIDRLESRVAMAELISPYSESIDVNAD